MTRSPGPALRAVVAQANRGRLLGVEREYEVLDAHGPVDARRLWAALPDPGAQLDPGDRFARRIPDGGVITADGPHAEHATSPVVLQPGCTTTILGRASSGRRHLTGQLSDHRLAGYSTHISVEVAERRVVPIADTIARRLALPIMLALDRVGSPGILVRPRHGRLEVGGEFAAGDQLRTAVVIVAAAVLLAERSLGIRRLRLPSGPTVRPERAVERFGWYVDRRSFGPDVYATGRRTRIGAASAGEVLERFWSAARPLVENHLSIDEMALADLTVAGDLPLPLEAPCDLDGTGAAAGPPRTRGYGPRVRPGFELRVARATWWRAVLELRGPNGTRWLTVPGRALDPLLDGVDTGGLDADLAALLGIPTSPKPHTRRRRFPADRTGDSVPGQ